MCLFAKSNQLIELKMVQLKNFPTCLTDKTVTEGIDFQHAKKGGFGGSDSFSFLDKMDITLQRDGKIKYICRINHILAPN